MKIALLITGSEILDGHVVDANTHFLANELALVGERIERVAQVRDDAAAITGTVSTLSSTHDAVVVSGGIGPTDDDITMGAVAKAAGVDLDGRIPAGSRRLQNGAGMADAAAVRVGNAAVFVFAGVPSEFRGLVRDHLVPFLKEAAGDRVTDSLLLKSFGIREAKINEIIGAEVSAVRGLSISYLPVFPEIHLRLSASGRHADNLEKVGRGEEIIRRHLRDHVWGTGGDTLPGVMGERLRKAGYKLALAESCTGGMIAQRVTSVAGASDYFVFGAVTYENRSKTEVLGVPADVLERHGAVSRETAEAMAAGAARVGGAEAAAGVTGIAGPGGGTDDKPVGTVHLAVKVRDEMHAEELYFPWGRDLFREVVSTRVLFLIWRMLGGWRRR
jgi:nicotinamide-nucleotide amidase